MNINKIQVLTGNYTYYKNNTRKVTPLYDYVSFTSSFHTGKLPECLDINTIMNLSEKSEINEELLDINNSGCMSQIFKIKPKGQDKIFAVKKVWPNNLRRYSGADLVKFLQKEAEIYKKFGQMDKIPRFYYHHFDDNHPEKNFLVLEWKDGLPTSRDGVFFDLKNVSKKHLGKIFDFIYEFDTRGFLHNDLWVGNILLAPDDISVIDFEAASIFNPIQNPEKSNLDNLKNGFLLRYFSDLYHRSPDVFGKSGEKKLLEMYKFANDLEAKLYLDKALKQLPVLGKANALRLIKKSNEIKNLTPNQLKEKALKEVFESDFKQGKMYTGNLDFDKKQTCETFRRAKDIIYKNPDIFKSPIYENKLKLTDLNIEICSKLTNAKKIINSSDLEKEIQVKKCLKLFKEINNKLNDKAYTEEEKKEFYYQNLNRFCDMNLRVFERLDNRSKDNALNIIRENRGLFDNKKKMRSYLDDLTLLSNKF
jgi:hypothetical protein